MTQIQGREEHLGPLLTQEQLDATAITLLSHEDRNALLALSPDEIDQGYPGFLSGERLRKCYSESAFLPNADLMDAMLFARQGSFEGLQTYTYEHINSSVAAILKKDPPELDEEGNEKDPTENIRKALAVVEDFMENDIRRTGEPGIAHIYRTLLRTTEIIRYYNELHETTGMNTYFTPQIAEVMYLSAILHDFVEDHFKEGKKNRQVGIAKYIRNDQSEGESNSQFTLRRAIYRNRGDRDKNGGDKYIGKKGEDVDLDLDDIQMKYLNLSLQALNSRDEEPSNILENLLGQVYEQYSSIPLLSTDEYILANVPIYIKTAADRPDNLATYFSRADSEGNVTTLPVKNLIAKAQENITMFNNAEIHMLLDSPSFFSSRDIIQKDNGTDITVNSPSSLPFFPSRWAKLILLGLTPNQIYELPERGGLPQVAL